MQIKLKLYASLTDLLPAGAKDNAIDIEVSEATTLNNIIDEYRVPRKLAHLVLINGVFVCEIDRDKGDVFEPGDVLAIWPPVAGG